LKSSPEWAPLTVINSDGLPITRRLLKMKFDLFAADDVFSADFLPTIILITNQIPKDISGEIVSFLSSKGCKSLYLARPEYPAWSEGPFFYSSRGIFSAWRLYADPEEAFIAATIPSQSDSTT
jgi:hypothetical protein